MVLVTMVTLRISKAISLHIPDNCHFCACFFYFCLASKINFSQQMKKTFFQIFWLKIPYTRIGKIIPPHPLAFENLLILVEGEAIEPQIFVLQNYIEKTCYNFDLQSIHNKIELNFILKHFLI